MTPFKKSASLVCALLMSACSTHSSVLPAKPEQPSSTTQVASELSSIRLATWNAEHLAYPAQRGCKPRDNEAVQALKDYANNLDADIIALQEVASKEALALIFPPQQWQLILSERPDSQVYDCRESGLTSTQQKVAFAVKHAVKIKHTEQFKTLALDNPGLRYGLQITVDSPFGDMAILNVHMKSGCFTDDYLKSDSPACQTYAQQAPLLAGWVAQQEASGQPYAVLGDFNHRISAPYNRLTRLLINDDRNLTIATRNLLGCHPRYPAPIDHILVGGMSSQNTVQNARFHAFADMTPELMLSDHCAVSVELSTQPEQLSSAVRWQTTSKEYQALTESVYEQAGQALPENNAENWVVVMDVDETVLDNSAYQVESEQSGRGYTPASWADWVAREEAPLVPGAREFVQRVFATGGKLALITNRDRTLDKHTWRNLIALGVPITPGNTCLLGRTAADKNAVTAAAMANDKDLRRQQISQGTARCFAPEGTANRSWAQPHKIVLQIGDNIEDFAGVTQENADIKQLLPGLGKRLFLLPNPMYGSW